MTILYLVLCIISNILLSYIVDGGPFTLLAPPDDAFSKLPPGTLDSILKNKTAAESKGKLHISMNSVNENFFIFKNFHRSCNVSFDWRK